MVVTNIHANVSGGASGTTINNHSTTSTGNLKNNENLNLGENQKRDLQGVFTPSQADTYNRNANSQTHWNRLTEWVALADIFPTNMSIANRQKAKIESLSIATQTQLESRLHLNTEPGVDTNLFVLYILSVENNNQKTFHHMYKQIKLGNVALNNGAETSNELNTQAGAAVTTALPNVTSAAVANASFTRPRINSVEIQFRARPWVLDQETSKWETRDINNLLPAIITTFDYEIAAGATTLARKDVGVKIWYEDAWHALPSLAEMLDAKGRRIDIIDGVVFPLQNAYANKWTFDDDTFVVAYKRRQVNCLRKNRCQWKVSRFTFKLYWEQPSGEPKPKIHAAKIEVFNRWKSQVPRFGWKSLVRGYDEGKPICIPERKYSRKHAACTRKNKCVVANCQDMDEIKGGCLRCNQGWVNADDGMSCYKPVDRRATRGCAYMQEVPIEVVVPVVTEEEFMAAKAVTDQRNWEEEVIDECERFDKDDDLTVLAGKHNILSAGFWRTPVVQSVNSDLVGLQRTSDWANDDFQDDELENWENSSVKHPKFVQFMEDQEWRTIFMRMYDWFTKDLADKLNVCPDCPEDQEDHHWNERNKVWVTSGLHKFFGGVVKQKMRLWMQRERVITRHGIKTLKKTAKKMKHCGNERPWGTSPVLMAKLAMQYGLDQNNDSDFAAMDRAEAKWDVKKERYFGAWKGLAEDVNNAYLEKHITNKDDMELVNLQAAKDNSLLNYMIAQYNKENPASQTQLRDLIRKAYTHASDGFNSQCPTDDSKGDWGASFCQDLEEMVTVMDLNDMSDVETAWRNRSKIQNDVEDNVGDFLIAKDQRVWAGEFCSNMTNKGQGRSQNEWTSWKKVAYMTFQAEYDTLDPPQSVPQWPTWYHEQKAGFSSSLKLFNQSATRFIACNGTNSRKWSLGDDTPYWLDQIETEILTKVQSLWDYVMNWAKNLATEIDKGNVNGPNPQDIKEALTELVQPDADMQKYFETYKKSVSRSWRKMAKKLKGKNPRRKAKMTKVFMRNAMNGFKSQVLQRDPAT